MKNEIEKRKDNDFCVAMLRKMAMFVVKILAKTSITPNQVSIFNFLIFTPVILYFFGKGTHLDNLIALFFIIVTMVFDLCDGTLARMKHLQSKLGNWLDGSFDGISQILMFCAVTVGVINNTGNHLWIFAGLAVLFGQSMANIMGLRYEHDFAFDSYTGSERFNNKFNGLKKVSFLDSFFKNIIVPSNFVYIILFTCRYMFLMGILFNKLNWFLVLFGLMINIRWIAMHIMYSLHLKEKESKLNTIRFLKEAYAENKIKN